MTSVVDMAPPWAVYLVVLCVVYLETSVLILGLILPSEAVLIAAGVAAAIGQPNIYIVIACACLAALCGDMTGYALGHFSGPRIQHSWAGRKFGDAQWERAEERVRNNSYVTVPVGRWIGYVRTLVPIAAGMSEVPAHRYALATFLGGTTWATTVLLLSYLLGATAGVQLMGVMVIGLIGTAAVLVLVRWLVHRIKLRRAASPRRLVDLGGPRRRQPNIRF
ncbi:DedA family protein [Gordonia phosphorivorans]|uniref:DedA family protein n=1 Tax=Gordonia phosphorivorans TaxID=1056982 RepID=A0ABV6HB33_9ACTN